jgi:hypothetical protein
MADWTFAARARTCLDKKTCEKHCARGEEAFATDRIFIERQHRDSANHQFG